MTLEQPKDDVLFYLPSTTYLPPPVKPFCYRRFRMVGGRMVAKMEKNFLRDTQHAAKVHNFLSHPTANLLNYLYKLPRKFEEKREASLAAASRFYYLLKCYLLWIKLIPAIT